MADFSFLSDTDDSAVEELLSQAQDLCVLEQVSAINCSSFTDSVLPSELDSRFRKLKSFPVTKSKPTFSVDSKNQFKQSATGKSDEDSAIFSPSKQKPEGELGLGPKSRSRHMSPSSVESLDFGEANSTPHTGNGNRNRKLKAKSKSKCGYVSSPSDSSSSSTEIDEISSPPKPKKDENNLPKANSERGFFSSPVKSSPSPPRKTGCFWCSPKKASGRKSSRNGFTQNDHYWSKNNEFLSDLSVFSIKEQQKILKKAMKEEEKINREAEKIVKWAKQASARMNISDIEDEFSGSENKK